MTEQTKTRETIVVAAYDLIDNYRDRAKNLYTVADKYGVDAEHLDILVHQILTLKWAGER